MRPQSSLHRCPCTLQRNSFTSALLCYVAWEVLQVLQVCRILMSQGILTPSSITIDSMGWPPSHSWHWQRQADRTPLWLQDIIWGAGIAQWLEHGTHDRNVLALIPHRNGGRIFFSRVNFLCWLLFQYMFHPHVTAVAHKRSWLFCQKCRWRGTAKHTCTQPMLLWMTWLFKLVCGCMVYMELAPRWQQFHVAPPTQQPNNAVSTLLWWISKIRTMKGYTHSESHNTSTVILLKSRN